MDKEKNSVLAVIKSIERRMATKEDLKGMATKEDIASIERRMATKEDLKLMATKEDLKGMATKEDLKLMATKEDLKGMATKEDVAGVLEVVVFMKDRMATQTELKEVKDKVFAIEGKLDGIYSKFDQQAKTNYDHKTRIVRLEQKVLKN
jgi:hypothetical protein